MKHAAIALVLLVIGAAGCNRGSILNKEEVVEVSPGEIKYLNIDPPKKDQKVKVQFSSPEPVTVEVTLGSDDKQGKSLAQKNNSKEDTIEVTVPANEKFCVVLSGNKKTKITVKLNNVD